MNEDEIELLIRIVEALEGIQAELHVMNDEGIMVFGGETINEN